ncbi:MAG: hypothetical protein E8D45_00885 [Nitrospira sp.]|nr:MAG: hypothetical protein E8D45_00885 [Nitrospira sp.]
MRKRSEERVRPLGTLRRATGETRSPVPAAPSLPLMIVRLLARAVIVLNRCVGASSARAVRIPADYRQWPSMTIELPSPEKRERATYYVRPNSAGIRHDPTFSTGTVFVVETSSASLRIRSTGHPASRSRHRLSTVFVMEKYADVHAPGVEPAQHAMWASAMYRPDGSLLAAGVMRACACERERTSA